MRGWNDPIISALNEKAGFSVVQNGIYDVNLRILAAGEAFGVQQFAKMWLLCGAVYLEGRPLPHVEMSLFCCYLVLLMPAADLSDDGLLNF